jgi:Flp pilus assembly protein TadG
MKKCSFTGDAMVSLAHLRRLRRENRGAAIVEFTLVAPILITLMCGLAEFSLALRQYHVMEKGVRDAARFLAAVPAHPPCTGIVDPAGATSWNTYVAQAKRLAIYGVVSGGTPLSKTWTNLSTVTLSPDPPTCVTTLRPLGGALPKIKVTATATYAGMGMLSAIGIPPMTLTVSHEELKTW